jgi:hypothetical protein
VCKVEYVVDEVVWREVERAEITDRHPASESILAEIIMI